MDDDTTTMMQQMGSDAAAAAPSDGGPASPMSTTSSSPGSGDDDGVAEVLPWKRKSNPTNNNATKARDLESMRNSVSDMHQRLKVQRQMAGRPYELENMDQEQVRMTFFLNGLVEPTHGMGLFETCNPKCIVCIV